METNSVSYIVMICFFKQKTAYEMRISDWSSDVFSSDLAGRRGAGQAVRGVPEAVPVRLRGAKLPRAGAVRPAGGAVSGVGGGAEIQSQRRAAARGHRR